MWFTVEDISVNIDNVEALHLAKKNKNLSYRKETVRLHDITSSLA